MRTARYTLTIASLFAALLWSPTPTAHACGGCVAPPGTFTAVDSHRMVVKLGIDESILWDQFIYSGAPEEFAWVLPVPSKDTVVELADAAFIDVMDEETSPRILAPACAGAAAAGCGCGDGFAPGLNLSDQVEVHSHALIGPYETVVLGAEDPNALYAWLGQNGYAFPDSGRAVLDYYTERQSSFVVLRLRPGVEVSAMQPVRVRFKGYMGQFPLRMISLGVSGAVDLSLWIVADERYAPTNFNSRTIAPSEVTWNWDTQTSNYEEVFQRRILDAGGLAWITEYAQVLNGSELAARLLERAPADLALAKAGIHYPVVTKLRTTLPVEALSDDLALARSDDPSAVSREITAGQSIGECAVEAAGMATLADGRAQLAFWLLAAAALLLVRRRRGSAS